MQPNGDAGNITKAAYLKRARRVSSIALPVTKSLVTSAPTVTSSAATCGRTGSLFARPRVRFGPCFGPMMACNTGCGRYPDGGEIVPPCVCCGFPTLTEPPPRTFKVCPVCFWEDDYAQFRD